MQWGNREHISRIGLCVGLVLLFCCLGFAPALADVLELPAALTQIADEAFMNDTAITSVVIPDGTTSIGARAFAGCGNLEKVYIPYSVQNIGNDAFVECANLIIHCEEGSAAEEYALRVGIICESIPVEIPEGLQYVLYDDYVVVTGYTGKQERVVLPIKIEGKPVTGIADKAFYGNTNLNEIVFPNQLTSIGYQAFSGCTSLTKVKLPDSVMSIAPYAFGSCSNLESINFPLSWERVPYYGNYNYYTPFMHCEKLTTIIVPEGVTKIPANAFKECRSLVKVELPETLETIDGSAFAYCYGLEAINIPESVTQIYGGAFKNCGSLTSIRIEGIKDVVDSVFENCESLTNIVFSEELTSIGYRAFSGCTSLTEVELPDSVTSIAPYAFGGCSNLEQINFPLSWETVPYYGNWNYYTPFAGCEKLTSMIVPSGVTKIPYSAFQGCSSLVSIELPDTLTTIDSVAFKNCINLTNIDIPDSVTTIYGGAFEYSTSLKKISLKGIDEISEEVFSNCTSLAEIEFSDNLDSIGYRAFENCTSLVRVELPNSVTSIAPYAFGGCSNLEQINFPLSWEIVPYYGNWNYYTPFSSCEKLTKISVPKGVVSIPANAFYGCRSLRWIYIPATVVSIGGTSFKDTATDLVIYGLSGSYAETYAAENGIAFSTDPFPGTEAEPDEQMVALSGCVTLADGTPVEDACIYVYDTIAEDWISLEYTDRNGDWACSVPADGSYTIHYLHDVYTIVPAEVSVSPTADMTLDTAIASLAAGEGAVTPVFAMQTNGTEIPTEGVKVGDVVTFSISAEGATKVRLIADGVAYNEYWLTDGSATIERSFTRAGTRQIAFQAYDGSDWGAVCEAQMLVVTADGTLDAPTIHAIGTQYVGESFTVTWDAVENAESYTVYLYRNELLWPALSNTDRSTTTGLSMEIPGDLLYTDGEYLIEIIASGYGYSQSSSSIKFTVEETAAGVEITYPTDGMTYGVGDTMHTRYAMGRGTQGVRLLVAPPEGEPVLYTPDESGTFYPVADQVGDYILTPYYSTSEGDFTAETADGMGESVTVTVKKPAVSSLLQGTNKQYSIRYTGTAQEFTGSVSNARYTVKVYLNDAFVQDITPEDGKFAFATDTLTETGKYVYSFVPCYGDIAGEPREFPVYMVEQETESVTKYAGEPMMLLSVPDGSVKASIAYGTEVTILGTYGAEYLYVSANDKDGFVAADSNLIEVVDSIGGGIMTYIRNTGDIPYSALGMTREYTFTTSNTKDITVCVQKSDGSKQIYHGVVNESDKDEFFVSIPIEEIGSYTVSFTATSWTGEEIPCNSSDAYVAIDTSYEYADQECWSRKYQYIEVTPTIFVEYESWVFDTQIDAAKSRIYCLGEYDDKTIYVRCENNDGTVEYAFVKKQDVQFEKNKTEYRAICIINPYYADTADEDICMVNYERIQKALNRIDGMHIMEPVDGKEWGDIINALDEFCDMADYNDVSYIYWSGHGLETEEGGPAYAWGILPQKKKESKDIVSSSIFEEAKLLLNSGTYSEFEYFYLSQMLGEWEGKINIIIDSCYAGDFASQLTASGETDTVNHVFKVSKDKVAVLMATDKGETSIYGMLDGGLFTKRLLEYVNEVETPVLGVIANNTEIGFVLFESDIPTTTYWGKPNRIFFAEDPDAVN